MCFGMFHHAQKGMRTGQGIQEVKPQPPILPCPVLGDFRMGVHAGKGAGRDTSEQAKTKQHVIGVSGDQPRLATSTLWSNVQ